MCIIELEVTLLKKILSVPSDLSNSLPNPAAKKRFGKKLYLVVAAVVIVAVLVAALFIPQGEATIPLSVDYKVGEKMVYDSTMSMTLTADSSLGSLLGNLSYQPKTTEINGQQTIEVMSFDGENYLLNHTTTMTVLNRPFSYSVTEKMNKTGYSTYLLDMGSVEQEVSSDGLGSNTFLAELLSRPEVKVGDTVTIPYPNNNPSLQTTGDLTLTFGGIEDLTVPAGTYKVFRLDISSKDLTVTLNPQALNLTSTSILGNLGLKMDLGINYQVYLEYGTLRQIKSSMQETAAYQSTFMNMTAAMGMDMTLTQHVKP
jgi:hypothetical protein